MTRPRADAELREQVGRLLEDWRLEDPNPEAYGRVLRTPGDRPSQTEAPRPDVGGRRPSPSRCAWCR